MSLASTQTPKSSILDAFDLRGERLEAAQVDTRHVLVLAGPGAGKTRLLCAHAAWLASQHEGIVRLLTFSKKAAMEMQGRVSQALAGHPHAARRVAASTLHSYGLQLLTSYGGKLGLPPEVDVLDRSDVDDLASRVARERGLPPPSGFADWLERVRRLGQDTAPGLAVTPEGQLLSGIEQKMKEEGAVDQGALITWATQLLHSFPFIRASVRHHVRFLLVDEAQDCDPAQLSFLEALLGEDGQVHLFVVMDPDQSLYGWRDADPDRVLSWARKHQPVEYQLTENYRCSAAISRLAKYVLMPETDLAGLPPSRLYRASGRDDEARFVHTQIRERALQDLPYRRMAVLGRASWRLQELRDWLSAQGIPLFQSAPGEWSERERRILLSLFALDEWQSQVEPGPHGSRFLHEVLDVEDERLQTLEQQAVAQRRHPGDLLDGKEARYWQELKALGWKGLSPIALIQDIGTLYEMEDELLERDGGLLSIARSSRVQTLRSLLREVRRGPMPPRSQEGLLLTTFHGAKGLEFDAVFVVGCEDGIIPDKRASSTPNAGKRLLEERRALYVALTRAAKEVVITWDASRGQRLCPFLPEDSASVWQPLSSDLRLVDGVGKG